MTDCPKDDSMVHQEDKSEDVEGIDRGDQEGTQASKIYESYSPDRSRSSRPSPPEAENERDQRTSSHASHPSEATTSTASTTAHPHNPHHSRPHPNFSFPPQGSFPPRPSTSSSPTESRSMYPSSLDPRSLPVNRPQSQQPYQPYHLGQRPPPPQSVPLPYDGVAHSHTQATPRSYATRPIEDQERRRSDEGRNEEEIGDETDTPTSGRQGDVGDAQQGVQAKDDEDASSSTGSESDQGQQVGPVPSMMHQNPWMMPGQLAQQYNDSYRQWLNMHETQQVQMSMQQGGIGPAFWPQQPNQAAYPPQYRPPSIPAQQQIRPRPPPSHPAPPPPVPAVNSLEARRRSSGSYPSPETPYYTSTFVIPNQSSSPATRTTSGPPPINTRPPLPQIPPPFGTPGPATSPPPPPAPASPRSVHSSESNGNTGLPRYQPPPQVPIQPRPQNQTQPQPQVPAAKASHARMKKPTNAYDIPVIKGVKPFINKLRYMLINPSEFGHTICWSNDGQSVLVHMTSDRLQNDILPRVYQHRNSAAFGRQFIAYGFERLKGAPLALALMRPPPPQPPSTVKAEEEEDEAEDDEHENEGEDQGEIKVDDEDDQNEQHSRAPPVSPVASTSHTPVTVPPLAPPVLPPRNSDDWAAFRHVHTIEDSRQAIMEERQIAKKQRQEERRRLRKERNKDLKAKGQSLEEDTEEGESSDEEEESLEEKVKKDVPNWFCQTIVSTVIIKRLKPKTKSGTTKRKEVLTGGGGGGGGGSHDGDDHSKKPKIDHNQGVGGSISNNRLIGSVPMYASSST